MNLSVQNNPEHNPEQEGVLSQAPDFRQRFFWYDVRNLVHNPSLIRTALYHGLDWLVIKPPVIDEVRKLSLGTKLVIDIQDEADLETIQNGDVVMSKSPELLTLARNKGLKSALWADIEDAESLEKAYKQGADYDFLVVRLKDETNIPLELVVAELQSKPTKVLKIVSTAQDAEVSFAVVEHGADGTVLQTAEVEELVALEKIKERYSKSVIPLKVGHVTRVEHVGMGHRACVDVTSLMTRKEGMLVGSTSTGGILACSETHPLPYMDIRPFRVNAGAMYSYIWCPQDRTHYLSELNAGSKVLCVNVDGETREVTVGRVKVELRPLMLIEVECEGIKINAILQDDWHVRVYGEGGKPVSLTTFKVGDPILCYTTEAGRHVGIKIDEQIIER